MPRWTVRQMPDQRDRTAVVTGATSGIGFETAAALAIAGAHVVLGARNVEKGEDAADRIRKRVPHASLEILELDLTSLRSIRAAADVVGAAHRCVDLLINNAGVMLTPHLLTEDGFEMQLGTNHLGHFAFTGLLLDKMMKVAGSRVVTVSSLGHRVKSDLDFEDLQCRRHYDPMVAYGRSKLANLLFTYELNRRIAANRGCSTAAMAAHPGSAKTGLFRSAPRWIRAGARIVEPVLFQSPAMGALPTLRAATDPTVTGGQYLGPRGFGEQRGYPTLVRSSDKSHDPVLAGRLWAVSEDLTGVAYPC